MCKGWLGYSAQHCQVTVPKLILVLLGSVGEIGGLEVFFLQLQRIDGQDATIT